MSNTYLSSTAGPGEMPVAAAVTRGIDAQDKPGGDKPTMTSLELVDFINSFRQTQAEESGQPFPSKGFAELQHKDFLEKVPAVLGERSAEFSADLPDSYGRFRKGYRFPKREACLMAMSYSYELQAAVYDRMTAMEERTKGPQLPDFTDPVAAARAWADQLESTRQAEALAAAETARADEAIRTKAWIGSKREATAMATAAAAIRKTIEIEDRYGFGMNYKQVKGITWLSGYFNLHHPGVYSVIGRALSVFSKNMGYRPRAVNDEKYGIVQSYHTVVLEAFKRTLDEDENLLAKYRKEVRHA